MTKELESRRRVAIETYCDSMGYGFTVNVNDGVNYKITDGDNMTVGYAIVKARYKSVARANPVFVSARSLFKLIETKLEPVIIWSCNDGILYGDPRKLAGDIVYGDFSHDEELANESMVVFYRNTRALKRVMYI